MNKKVLWILAAVFAALCAGETAIALKKALEEKKIREEEADLFQD